MKKEDVLILDVRDHSKRQSEGYLQIAYHIPVNNMWERCHELDEYLDKKILVHCGIGCGASATAAWILRDQGFSNVEDVNRLPAAVQRFKELTGEEAK